MEIAKVKIATIVLTVDYFVIKLSIMSSQRFSQGNHFPQARSQLIILNKYIWE
jgi:hypothetical protein